MKKKRILIIAQALNGGGAENFLKNIIEINTKDNFETIVCSTDDTTHLSVFFENHNIRVYKSRLFYFNDKISWVLRKKIIRLPFSKYLFSVYEILSILPILLKTRPDLVLVSNTIQSSQFGYLFLPIPVIFFIHSVPFECNNLKKKFVNVLTNKSFKNKIATVSVFNAHKVDTVLGIDVSKIRIIPNGVYLPPKMLSIKEREDVILTVGHFEAYKNVEIWLSVAIEFVKRNPSYKFIWIGSGSLLSEYQLKINEMNLGDSIKLLGHQNHLKDHYQKAKIYFHPSLFETQGISILEAMSFCVPCVASAIGGIPETISHEENGYLCDPNDVDGFIRFIAKLINDKALYQSVQEAGYKKVKDKFSIERNKFLIKELYGI